jgi:hypothetical protein
MASIATMEAIFLRSILIAFLFLMFACSTAAQTDKGVDCKKVPDHPNCAPRG